jgi:tRNA G18 (ribose-2'-O)-methylase SpoU
MISEITVVSTLDMPDLEPYRTLKREQEHRDQGVFIAEGHIVVERLLKTSHRIISVLFTDTWLEHFREHLEQRPEPIHVLLGEKELLKTITGYHLHQFIMALAEVPPVRSLESCTTSQQRPYLFVALDGLTSADNVGLVVRNCTALGVDALIAGETAADPWLRRAVRKSMGTIFKLPVIYSSSLIDTLKTLRERHLCALFAAQVNSDSVNCYRTDFTRSCCLVVGNEGCGVSRGVLDVCDSAVAIPMAPDVDSFNVSSASAILLSEIVRQRKWVSSE